MELTKLDWDFSNKSELNKYIDTFLNLYNQLSIAIQPYMPEKITLASKSYLLKELVDYKKKHSEIFLYFENKVVIGYCSITPGEDPNIVWVSDLLVSKDYRNRGYGTYILKDIINMLKTTKKYKYIYLNVIDKNPAKYLYTKLGFTPYAHTLQYTGEGLQSLIPDFIKSKSVTDPTTNPMSYSLLPKKNNKVL